MDERPWTEEENLQTDRERAEKRKTVKKVFGRIALGLSGMILVFSILLEFLAPVILNSVPGGEGNINVVFVLSQLTLYSVGIITYLILNRWVPNAPTGRALLPLAEPFGEEVLSDKGADPMGGLSRPRGLTLRTGGMLVAICLALGFIFNLITLGISYGINLFNHAREVREITQQYLETGYGVIPEPPNFLEVDPLIEMVGGINPILSFLIVVVTTSVFEEMIFRKLLYDKLIVFGGKVYIIASSMLFALFHLNHRQLLYTFAVGVVFAGVMYYTKKVSYCIVLHMGFNSFGVLGLHIHGLPETIEMLYGILFFGLVVTGMVFLVKGLLSARRWATFEPAQIEVKKKRDIFFNPGMIIFLILSIGGMIGGALYFSA